MQRLLDFAVSAQTRHLLSVQGAALPKRAAFLDCYAIFRPLLYTKGLAELPLGVCKVCRRFSETAQMLPTTRTCSLPREPNARARLKSAA